MSGLQIGKAIYYILSGNTTLHNYIGDKIYPILAPDEILTPFIVYERNNINPFYTKDGLSYDECSILINIISQNYFECVSISDLIRSILEFKVGTYSGVTILDSKFSNASENFGVDGYITQLEFTIKSK